MSDLASDILEGKRVLFLGKLGSMTKRDVRAFVRDRGGVVVREDDPEIHWVVIGAEELPINYRELIPAHLRDAAAAGHLEIVTETEWWQRLGEVDETAHVRQLYTPAMLADLVGVPLSVIRRWHRRGLISPVREVHRLAYYDFREVATARQLAGLLAAGVSPQSLERELEQLVRFVPDVERPLEQLAVIAEGRQLLLRQGEGLIDADGQRRFDFEFTDSQAGSLARETAEGEQHGSAVNGDDDASAAPRHALPFRPLDPQLDPQPESGLSLEDWSVDQWLDLAMWMEDHGRLEEAVELYRTVLMMTGPQAEWCFRLAELFYRLGDITAARERYYMAIELDEDYVEARANLGCVLAEVGQQELALAAFQGALARHPDYPDVQYHLAKMLDEMGREQEAIRHWQVFLDLAPDSPWAEDARQRLNRDVL